MTNPSYPVHQTLPKSQQKASIDNININCRHVFRTLSRHAPDCILLGRVSLFPRTAQIASSSTECYFVVLFSHYSTKLHTIFFLIYFCLHSPTALSSTWNLQPARWGITIHRRIKKPTLREHLHVHWRRQPIFIADQMFELPTQPSSIVLEIANVRAMICMKQDDDDTYWVISENQSEDPGESTLSSDSEEDDLDNQQEVLHLDQAHCDKTIWTTRVPLPTKQSRADTVIAPTSLPNLRPPAGAIAPQLLKCQGLTFNILRESDVVPAQALQLPMAGGDQNVPQPKAGGDHNVPQHQLTTFEVVKWFMEAIIFTRLPGQSFPMRSTWWWTKLGNLRLKPRIVSRH